MVTNPDTPLTLLGGLTPAQFMKTHWQRKPLLVRQAIPGFRPPLSVAAVKKMSRRDDVESRLVWQEQGQWHMQRGPFARLPSPAKPDWTVLVQSVDIHDDSAAALMNQFRFIPDARLDDLMISVATDGGGVGPHFDSYDVFLLQAHGRRRWRFGQQKRLDLIEGLALKILRNFEPEQEFDLEPGDMLYLPPQCAHDGIALGDCMTISIGFRVPDTASLARGMLEAAADQVTARAGGVSGPYGEPPLPGPTLNGLYKDPGQPATAHPAQIPDRLAAAALQSVARIRFDEALATRFLGCWLTEPNQLAVFDHGDAQAADDEEHALPTHWVLDRRTRMLYRGTQLFINGEVAPVRAEPGLRALADARELAADGTAARKLSQGATDALAEWVDAGWIHAIRRQSL